MKRLVAILILTAAASCLAVEKVRLLEPSGAPKTSYSTRCCIVDAPGGALLATIGPDIRRSTDGGRTWSSVVTHNAGIVSNETVVLPYRGTVMTAPTLYLPHPFTVTNAETGAVYEEGVDYVANMSAPAASPYSANPIHDSEITEATTELALALPAGSAIAEGDRLLVTYNAPFPWTGMGGNKDGQFGTCMSNPGLYEEVRNSAEAIFARIAQSAVPVRFASPSALRNASVRSYGSRSLQAVCDPQYQQAGKRTSALIARQFAAMGFTGVAMKPSRIDRGDVTVVGVRTRLSISSTDPSGLRLSCWQKNPPGSQPRSFSPKTEMPRRVPPNQTYGT